MEEGVTAACRGEERRRGCKIPVGTRRNRIVLTNSICQLHPQEEQKRALCQGMKSLQRKIAVLPSTEENSFLQRLIYFIFWLQNAIKQCIENCMIKPGPWVQSMDNPDSLQTSIPGSGSAQFFHQWHPQLWSVLRNPPLSPSLAEVQRGTGCILALQVQKQDLNCSFILTGLVYFSQQLLCRVPPAAEPWEMRPGVYLHESYMLPYWVFFPFVNLLCTINFKML